MALMSMTPLRFFRRASLASVLAGDFLAINGELDNFDAAENTDDTSADIFDAAESIDEPELDNDGAPEIIDAPDDDGEWPSVLVLSD